ncbi:hypothetical protein EMIT013CA1_10062 [Bacillus sp. IT-13CA1]
MFNAKYSTSSHQQLSISIDVARKKKRQISGLSQLLGVTPTVSCII